MLSFRDSATKLAHVSGVLNVHRYLLGICLKSEV